MKHVIGFDMDGVLADFVWGFTAQARRMFGPQIPVEKTETHAVWDVFPGLNDAEVGRVWKHIKADTSFWRMLEPCVPEYVMGSVAQLANAMPVYFITNRPGESAKTQTEGWLRDHGVYNPTVVVTGKKGYAVDALGVTEYIDDKAGNAVFTKYENPFAKVYLLDRPYNAFDQAVLGTKVCRVKTVEEFLNTLNI